MKTKTAPNPSLLIFFFLSRRTSLTPGHFFLRFSSPFSRADLQLLSTENRRKAPATPISLSPFQQRLLPTEPFSHLHQATDLPPEAEEKKTKPSAHRTSSSKASHRCSFPQQHRSPFLQPPDPPPEIEEKKTPTTAGHLNRRRGNGNNLQRGADRRRRRKKEQKKNRFEKTKKKLKIDCP